MELTASTAVIERSHPFEEKTFSIGNPVVIMQIMRSKLYSNPVKVLIQEYLCNARDANREAGSDKAIEIYCPTVYSETFEIRDYGIGISPSRMENVFIKYGESTKRKDNLQTGGFGIGAKSGWSYSDSFSVTTITEEDGQNVKRFYACIIDETQKGSLIKLAEDIIVEEPTGTRIIVPVKKKDFDLFAQYVKQTVFFWKEAVILMGSTNEAIKYDWANQLYKGDDWVLNQNQSLVGEFQNTNKCLAVVDGIQYDIKLDALSECKEIQDNGSLAKDIFNNKFIIFFKTGDLNISANREELYYDEKTKDAIVAKLKKIVAEFKQIVEIKFNQETNYLNLVVMWREFISVFHSHHTKGHFLSNFKWQGQDTTITTEINSDDPLTIREYYRYLNRRRSRTVSRMNIIKNTIAYENDEGDYAIHRKKMETLWDLHPHGFYLIGYGDTRITPDSIRHKSGSYDAWTTEELEKAIVEKRKEYNFDLFGFTKTSTIERKKNPVVPRTSQAGIKKPSRIKMITRTVGKHGHNHIDIESVEIDIHSQIGYYATAINAKTYDLFGSSYRNDHHSGRMLTIMKYFKLDTVYLVPEKMMNKAKAHKKGFVMKSLYDLIDKELIAQKDNITKIFTAKSYLHNDKFDEVLSFLKKFDLLNNHKEILDPEMLDIINLVTKNEVQTTISELIDNLPSSKFQDVAVDDTLISKMIESIKAKYPLSFEVTYRWNTERKLVLDYLNMVYLFNKNKACLSAKT
jgi:hypothetical protein